MQNQNVDDVRVDRAKNCARMDVIAKLIDQGIVPPPDASDEQVAAFEYANGYMRSVIAAALSEDC